MSTTTTISWATKTWNPTVGCSRKDPGCDNCYAINVAHRKMSKSHVGLTKLRVGGARPGPDWNGKVRLLPERLEDPLRWSRGERVFVDSMSDLFHTKVPDAYIRRVFDVMTQAKHHTFLVLTKRSDRLAELGRRLPYGENIQLGVSVSDQATWNELVPALAMLRDETVRWVSLEPMLGPVDIRRGLVDVDWIVVGGESGPGARPYDVDWPRAVIQQCRYNPTPVFHKQVGARPMMRADSLEGRRAGDHPERDWPEGTRFTTAKGHKGTQWQGRWARLQDQKGEDMAEWPAHLRVREYPETRA
jgi:protein gp37